MVNYNNFNTTKDHSFNVYNALLYCRQKGEDGLIFNKGTYDFYAEKASEDVLHVSNHDIYGIERIAFLLKDMKNFTIDGGGSTFVFHNAAIPFAIVNSENITIKNIIIDHEETMTLDLKVFNVGKDFFDVDVLNDDKYYILGSKLYLYDSAGHNDMYSYFGIKSTGDGRKFTSSSKEVFRESIPDAKFEELGEKKFRVYNTRLNVTVGMHLLTRSRLRYGCNIISTQSKNVCLNNITMYRSYGMGVLALKTENVTNDRMVVEAAPGRMFSLNCDGTHFVHCKGLIKITNSSFSEQQDDAVNVHGLYTKIVDKTKDYILVKYMHSSAKGLDIYDKGSEFAVLNPKTLIPNAIYKTADVEVINMQYTKIFVKGGTDSINIGDVVEDLTWSCDLLFENNKVTNNRARGMLIAAKGTVKIKNNYFNTPGIAILFESDGRFWFESGGTSHVEITDNIFENCCFATNVWGNDVINVKPREEWNEGKFYHNYISVTHNRFVDCATRLLFADNIKTVEFFDNTTENCKSKKLAEFAHCGNIKTDIK